MFDKLRAIFRFNNEVNKSYPSHKLIPSMYLDTKGNVQTLYNSSLDGYINPNEPLNTNLTEEQFLKLRTYIDGLNVIDD